MTISFLEGVVFLALLAGAALEDWRTGYISDGWSLAAGLFGAVRLFVSGSFLPLVSAAAVFFFFLCLRCFRCAGEGDGLLASAAALWMSPESCAVFLWTAFVLGGLAGAVFLISGKRKKEDRLPFAPFLCIAGGIAYGWGDALWHLWLAS